MQVDNRPLRNAGYAALLAIALQACNRGKYPETPLRHADLPATGFDVRTDRDTSLRTPGGTRLDIPAGSLQSDSGGVARLLVREAYNAGQMLRGGLTTVSGSDILSTSGMIALAPGAHTRPALTTPIRVTFAPAAQRPGAQLWTDTGSASRRIDWQDPKPLQPGAPTLVQRLGWYATATLIKDLDGFENYNTLAQFSGAIQDGISVYLLLPEDGIVLEGGPSTSGAGSYAFYRNDGTVPLRPGKPAVVVGVKEIAGQWHFASKKFNAAPAQTLQLELRPISRAALDQALEGLGRTGGE